MFGLFTLLRHLVLIDWFLFPNILALKIYMLVSLNWCRCFLLMLLRMPLSWWQNYGPTTIQRKLKPIRNIYQGICLLVIVSILFPLYLFSYNCICIRTFRALEWQVLLGFYFTLDSTYRSSVTQSWSWCSNWIIIQVISKRNKWGISCNYLTMN